MENAAERECFVLIRAEYMSFDFNVKGQGKMGMRPKISVVIPVYNAEKYLRQCIDSVIGQTMEDIEIICIDDCSTDNSVAILKGFSQQDSRMHIICFPESRSALAARKTGVLKSCGEYIIFLDSDDYLEENACEELYGKISNEQVDILQFLSQVENCANLPEARIQMNQRLLTPCGCRLEGTAVFEACFVKNDYGFTLWNKVFKASVCKEAMTYIEDLYLPKAQDLYMYFVIAYLSKSYLGWEGRIYHHYCFGRGVTGSEMDLNKFECYCLQAHVVTALRRFCAQKGIEVNSIILAVNRLEDQWMEECIKLWFHLDGDCDTAHATEILLSYWDEKAILERLANQYWYSRHILSKKIRKLSGTPLAQKKICTIAIYYHHYTIGGAQRVIALLLPMLQGMGYHVVLITDEEPSEDDFDLCPGVVRTTIFSYIKTNRNTIRQRLEGWDHILKEYRIDLLLYHSWASPILFWDLVYLKKNNVSVIVQSHSIFSYSLTRGTNAFSVQSPVLALADGIVTLSEVDQVYWSAYNPCVYHIPNPVDPELREAPQSNGTVPIITWIGRLSEEKQPWEALNIMEHVIRKEPLAQLYMIGGAANGSILEKYTKIVKKKGMEQNVKFLGYQKDISQFLQKATVNLITSKYEGYSMVIIEAQAHGVPTVMYEMPYLTLAKKEYGNISVEMNNSASAAAQIVKLLQFRAIWEEKHRLAQNSFAALADYNLEQAWSRVIRGEASGAELTQPVQTMIHTISDHYLLGWKYNNSILNQKDQGNRRLIRFITFLPRKIRGGIRCCQDHGVRYTLYLAKEKFFAMLRGERK